jgi:hypothetical protein
VRPPEANWGSGGTFSILNSRRREVVIFACCAVFAIVLAPSLSPVSPTNPSSGARLASGSTLPQVNITVGQNVANESSTFWGVNLDGTYDPENHTLAALLNQTPIKTLRYGANLADEENWTYNSTLHGCFYNNYSDCNSTLHQENVTQFATLCQWLVSDQCDLGIPAEIDSVSTVLWMAKWLNATTHGWQPNCWEIGNEPQTWWHFGYPWSEWNKYHLAQPTGSTFARVVQNYTKALRSINHNACVIGVESDSNAAKIGPYLNNTTKLQPNVTEVAFHDYPDTPTGSCPGTASQALSQIDLTSIQRNYTSIALRNVTTKPKLPVDVDEFNLGYTSSMLPSCRWLASPTNAVFVSAAIAQALARGVPRMTFFRFDCGGPTCMFNNSHSNLTLAETPNFLDYSGVLSHMDISRIYNVTFSSAATSGTYMALGATDTGLNQSLLVVDANPSGPEDVNVAPAVPSGWVATTICESGYGVVYTAALASNNTVTVGNQSTCVIQASSPCTFPGCDVSMIALAKDAGTGAQTVGPINATGRSLLYLAIQQDFSAGAAPTITDHLLTWSLRSSGARSGSGALWLYTAVAPRTGVTWHNFTVEAADTFMLGFILIDLPGSAGFDPQESSAVIASSYISTTPATSISTDSPAAYLTFISTIGASGGSPSLSPRAGQDVFDSTPTPSYAVSCIYGAYSSGTQTVGGTFNMTESGWVIPDAVDLNVTGNTSVNEISAVDNEPTGTQSISSFSATAGSLLYLAIAQDYSGGVHPFVNDTVLSWSQREHGASSTKQATWVFIAMVPAGGISAHTFTIRANDGLHFGYLLVDLTGYSGFDPNVPSVAANVSYSSSTTPSVSLSANSQALYLAFVSTVGATGTIALTPNPMEEVMNSDPSPTYAVALLFATGAAGSATLGGTFSTAESGWVISDAVDAPNSGNASVNALSYQKESAGVYTVPSIGIGGGDLLLLAIAQDYDSGSPPIITDSVLTWGVAAEGGSASFESLWVYNAIVPYGGIASHSFTIEAADHGPFGYILIDLHGLVGFDRDSSSSGVQDYSSSTTPSASVMAYHRAAYLAFISTNSATGTILLTPDSGESVFNSDPSPSYQVALIYSILSSGTQTVGGTFSTAQTGWVDYAADDT